MSVDLEQAHDRRNDLVARQAVRAQVAIDPPSQARKGAGESDRPLVLCLVARSDHSA